MLKCAMYVLFCLNCSIINYYNWPIMIKLWRMFFVCEFAFASCYGYRLNFYIAYLNNCGIINDKHVPWKFIFIIPSPTKLRGDIVTLLSVLPSIRHNPCEHSRINILQWILTKLGTYLVLKKIWNPIDFQGQRSMSLGEFFTV